MPFLAVRIPRWFSERFPQAAANLRLNSDRLTTPFDLHETLMDVVDMERSRHVTEGRPRAYSLFQNIPDDRTCADADIEAHWSVSSYRSVQCDNDSCDALIQLDLNESYIRPARGISKSF